MRELKDGARPIDPDPASWSARATRSSAPAGRIAGDELLQVKGFSYALGDLLGDPDFERPIATAATSTLRLTAGHVSPLSRAARLRGRAGDYISRRHLERQSDRAEADREAVLQQRARSRSARGSRPQASSLRWCRSRRSSWPASGCTFSMLRERCSNGGTTRLRLRRVASPKATRWAGSSMARRSSCLRPEISRSATGCAKAAAFAWASPSCSLRSCEGRLGDHSCRLDRRGEASLCRFGPVDDLEAAVIVLGNRRAAFHPVAAVDVDDVTVAAIAA